MNSELDILLEVPGSMPLNIARVKKIGRQNGGEVTEMKGEEFEKLNFQP